MVFEEHFYFLLDNLKKYPLLNAFDKFEYDRGIHEAKVLYFCTRGASEVFQKDPIVVEASSFQKIFQDTRLFVGDLNKDSTLPAAIMNITIQRHIKNTYCKNDN